jgi:hypothetical protein
VTRGGPVFATVTPWHIRSELSSSVPASAD